MAVEDMAAIPWGRGREPSNAEQTGVSGVVDQPLGAVVSADELRSPSASSVAWEFAWRAHTARQVQLHQIGAKGSSQLSHQQQGHALAVASQQAVVVPPASPPQYVSQQPPVAGWSPLLLREALQEGSPGAHAWPLPRPPCGNFFVVFHLRHNWGWCRGCHSLHRHYVLYPLRRLWCRLNFALHLIDTKSHQFHQLFWKQLAVQIGSVAVWLAPRLAGQVWFQTCDRADT